LPDAERTFKRKKRGKSREKNPVYSRLVSGSGGSATSTVIEDQKRVEGQEGAF